jgi:hypothetical protein
MFANYGMKLLNVKHSSSNRSKMSLKEKLTKVRLGAKATIVILTLLAPTILTTGAFAQPPSNDDIENATVIPSLPFHDRTNT